MDHGRIIINETAPRLTSKRPKMPFVTTTDAPFVKDEPIVEDHRLVNWRRWLQRHHRQYRALDKGGPRSKSDLVMNSYAEERPQMEMRNLMENATIAVPRVPEKYQGNLGFWKIPPLLSNHGNSCLPEVRPVLTKKELNLPSTLEYVDIPMSIREEENLPNPSQKVTAWKHSSYLEKRKRELADAIAILQPSVPDTANLIARGQGFGHAVEDVSRVPVISIMDASLENDDSEVNSRQSPLSTDVVLALKINGVEITRDEELPSEPSNGDSEEITWTLNFSNKLTQKSGQCLHFENTGTVAITFQWRNATVTSNILSLPSRGDVSFFFNKNKALILPGQKVEFPVWFQQRQAGIFSEVWGLKTDPIVSRAALVIRMRGHAASEDCCTSSINVDAYLDRCIRNTAIRETINEIIRDIRSLGPPEPAYETLYLEEKLFRAKNPSYFYHASLVAQFHRLYTTDAATGVSSWTLSLIDLRRVLLQIKNPDLRHEKLEEFSNLCHQCLEPTLYNPVRNTKSATVYNILCVLANRMDDESEFVKRNCFIANKDSATTPIQEKYVSDNMATPLKSSITHTPKNKRSSKASRSSSNSLVSMLDVRPLTTILDRTALTLYREVFYVRIYELLTEAVEQACAVIDSLNDLHELEL